MANLKNRIKKLTKLRGPVEKKGINSLDLFLVGALSGLYSKRLFIQNEDENLAGNEKHSSSSYVQQQHSIHHDDNSYAKQLKAVSSEERLSKSVSDYVLKLEKEEYSDYAKGFYTSQLDNIAKVFASTSDTVALSDFARRSLASMDQNKQVEYNLAQDKKNITPSSAESSKPELVQEKMDEIEKASGEQPDDPSYQEILDTFREGLEGDSLQDEKSVQKDADSVKTAGASSEIFSADSSEDHSEKESSEKGNSSSDGTNDLSTEKEDKIELAQAEDSPKGEESASGNSSNPPSGAEAAGGAQSSILGSIGMVPVAAVGLGQLVSKVMDSGSSISGTTGESSGPVVPIEETIIRSPGSPSTPTVEPVVVATPALAFQGRVVDGYVVGATVFYDENNNGILDDSESNYVGVTDADGNFQLPDFSGAAQGGSVVVLPGGVDTNTGHKIGAMQVNVPKDADGNPILSDPDSPDAQAAISSPLTLILAQNSDIVEADLIAQLGMTGVEEKGLAFYDPVSEMQAGNNNSLAEYVFTIQQQLFSVIQAGSKIAGEAAGLSALEVSVKAVGDAMKTALENGTALTVDSISNSAIAAVANGSGFSSLASGFATIVNQTNQRIESGYEGMALALSDSASEDSINLLSNARATAAASQDTLLSTIETALDAGSLDVSGFSASLSSVIEENTAVFGTVLQAESGDGSSGLSEFGNSAFIVTKLLEQTGSGTRDVVDLSSSISTLSLEQLAQLGVAHVRLLGSNTSVEISMGNVSDAILSALNDDAIVDDVNTTLVDESAVDDGLFASNYTVTLKVTDDQVASVVANAVTLNAAGIDVIKPVEGTLSLTLDQVRNLQSLGFEFASGLVRFSATSADSLTFDEIYTLLNSGLKLTDASQVSVSIPDGDSRSTFSTIKDLASRGVSFDGGTITLTQDDLKGSFNVLQAQLLDAAKSNIVFDTESVSSWSLGKDSNGTSLGNPNINASDVTFLVNAGITLNDAVVNVTSTSDVQTIVSNAFELLTAGVKKFNFSSGISISTSDARTILDAKDLTIEQGKTYTDVIFSGEGVLSNLGDASLQSLSDFLAEGLGLDTTFVPEYSDALALVQLGITFPQGITLQATTETNINLADANTLVAAGVEFQGLFNVSYSKDSSLTEAQNLTAVSNLISAGLRPVASGGEKITISGTSSDPLYIRPTEWNALKEYVNLENASLVLTRSSDFLTAFGDLTSNASFWESQTQFSKFAVPLSVTPVYSQLKTLADLNTVRSSGDGTSSVSLVRVSKSGDTFSELNTSISIRISSSSDLDAVNATSLKNSGVDFVDVLGVPLTVSQIQTFLGNDAPILQNAQLLISNANVADASALLQQSFDRDIFDAGITGFGVAAGTATTADVWKVFSDAYDDLVSGASSDTRIFDGGIITGAGTLTSGVGQVLDRLGRAGLKLSDSYAPSLTEVREFINSGGEYKKGIKISLQAGETLGPNEAKTLAEANVFFAANTPLDFSGQTSDTLTGAATDTAQVGYFKMLLEKGFLLQNLSADLRNLDRVTVNQEEFELLNSNGFDFSNSKINVANKMELVSAAVKIASTANHGITHLQVPETMVPSFGQAKLLLGAGLSFEMYSSDGTITNLGTTIQATSVSQLESLARQINSLETMGVSKLDLAGLEIPVDVAKIFAEAQSSSNITFLNRPKLLIGSEDNLSEIPSILDEVIALGVNEITFQDGVEVSAVDAHAIITASNQITFSNGFISDSEGIPDDELKSKLSELKQKGMLVSPSFRPSLGIELTGNAQTDSGNMLTMIRDGYKVNLQPNSGEVAEDEARPEVSFSNVFMSFRDFKNFANLENFGGNSSLPNFAGSFVTVKNSQELSTISSDLQLEDSNLLRLGVKNIAIQGNISPSLSQVLLAGSNEMSFIRVSKTDGEYTQLSGAAGRITLKAEESEIARISENATTVFSSGVERLNLFGKEISYENAQTLVDSGFYFEGGKIVAPSEKNSLVHLQHLAERGLALPNDMTLQGSQVKLDFALNRFKGSLEGASIDLSDNTGDQAVSLNQILRLMNRNLSSTESSEVRQAFVSSDESVSVQAGFSATNDLTDNTAILLSKLGFEEIVGEINTSSASKVIQNTPLDLSAAKIKGVGELIDIQIIVGSGNGGLLEDASVKSGTSADIEIVKNLIVVPGNQLDLSELTVSNVSVLPDDFLDVHQRITLKDDAVISGAIDSVDKANTLVDVATIPLDNVVLKNLTIALEANAESLVNLVQNGIIVYEDFEPTVTISDDAISVGDAIILGRAGIHLGNVEIVAGEVTDIQNAVELLNYQGLDFNGLRIEPADQLSSLSLEQALTFLSLHKNENIVFDVTSGAEIFAVNEDTLRPLDAIDLAKIGANLIGKKISVDGYSVDGFVPNSIALELGSINGLILEEVFTKAENLTDEQIENLESKGLRVDKELVVDYPNSVVTGQVIEKSETDPIGTDVIITTEGRVILENDSHSSYLPEINSVSDPGLENFDIRFVPGPDELTQELIWTYSTRAEDVEYLADGRSVQVDYAISLSEEFAGIIQEDVEEIAINIEILGTDDDPVIVFDEVTDVSTILREGRDSSAKGELIISERDEGDLLDIYIEGDTSSVHYEGGLAVTPHIPIVFKLTDMDSQQVISNDFFTDSLNFTDSFNRDFYQDHLGISSGNYKLEWEIQDTASVFEQLPPDSIIESDYIIKVSDSQGSSPDINVVSQTISIDFQSNRLPFLTDVDGNAPNLTTSATEDHAVVLTVEDFGYSHYADYDGDPFSSIRLGAISEDISLLYTYADSVPESDVIELSTGDIIEVNLGSGSNSFKINDRDIDLVVQPDQNINGSRFIEFNVGDGIDFSDQLYTTTFDFIPVVDSPIVKTRLSEDGEVSANNLKFVSDQATVYFEILPSADSERITYADISIQQQGVEVYNYELTNDVYVTSYNFDLSNILRDFNSNQANLNYDQVVNYLFTEPLEAHISVHAIDENENHEDLGTFQLVEEITVIPDSTKVKNEKEYQETLFGFSEFDNTNINFLDSGESDDTTFIDPEFGMIISTNDLLDGTEIDFETAAILGTKGDDFVFASSNSESEAGTLIHGGDGFDDLSGGDYADIIYIDTGIDGGKDVASGGLGDDVFVIHGDADQNHPNSLINDDVSKIDMNNRLDSLLHKESIAANDVKVAGTIEDFSYAQVDNSDSIVLSGFSENANYSLHTEDDLALLLIEDDTQDKLYTAAILMPEYGTFDSSDMDLMNDAIHKI